MGDFDRLQETVTEQAVTTAVLVKAVSSIEALLTQQTNSIREIEKAMKNQEILMEKFTHLDARITDSVNRIHKRIDNQENEINRLSKEHKTAIDEMHKKHSDKCEIIEPMAKKGEVVHGLLVKAAIGLAVALAGVVGSIIMWAIKQGAV